MEAKGLYGKYIVNKASGEPIEPEARYFVLRIDTDIHARTALRAYATSIFNKNPELARGLRGLLMDTLRTEAGQKELDVLAKKAERQAFLKERLAK